MPFGLVCVAILSYLGSTSSGSLVMESNPSRPRHFEHVTIRCYSSPAKFYWRRNCQFHWSWTPTDHPPTKDEIPVASLTASWWRVLHEYSTETQSLIAIEDLRDEYQGHYVCHVSCVGRKQEKTILLLEIGEEHGRGISAENSQIAYITVGIIVALIVIATVLRFACTNARECCRKRERMADNRYQSQAQQSDSYELYNYWSVHTIRDKPNSEHRPTILSDTVWLPSYEVALKMPLRSASTLPINASIHSMTRPNPNAASSNVHKTWLHSFVDRVNGFMSRLNFKTVRFNNLHTIQGEAAMQCTESPEGDVLPAYEEALAMMVASRKTEIQ